MRANLRRRAIALCSALLLLGGCSSMQDPIGATLTAPSELTAEAVGLSTIRVSWKPAAGEVTGYELQRRSDLRGDFEVIEPSIGVSVGARVVYFDTRVEPDRYYGYRVRALSQLGAQSAMSNVSGTKTSPQPGLAIRTLTSVASPEANDEDGFLAVVRGRSDTTSVAVSTNGTRVISPISPGAYTVALRGLASNCATTVAADTVRAVTITDEGTETQRQVTFQVSCRDPRKASIVTVVAVAGDTVDADGVTITASGIIREAGTPANERVYFETRVVSGSNGSTRFDNLRPGDYEISVGDIEAPCVLNGARKFDLQPRALAVDTVRFTITCRKPTVPVDTAGRPFVLRQQWAASTARPGDRIALLTSIDMSAEPAQELAGVSGAISFDPAVVRYDSSRTAREFDLVTVNARSNREIAFAALNTGGQGLTGNIAVMRTWYTVVGAAGTEVTTSTVISEVVTPPLGQLGNRTRVAESKLNISAVGAPNQPPTAVISGPGTATVGAVVSFSGAGSSDMDGSIASYAWSFGDGGSGSGVTASHTFAIAGTFNVRLTVTDNTGATATRDLTVTVTAASPTVGTIVGTVSSATRGALAGVTVSVTGGPNAQSSATGAYSIPGVTAGARTVTLSTLPAGCSAPAAQTVTVTAGTTATANFTVTCTPLGAATGTVRGRITRSTGGAGIAGARVLLQPTGGAALAPATSGDDGSYEVLSVPIGTGPGAGSGSLTIIDLPVGCETPGSQSYSGLAAGGTATVNIAVTCQTLTTGTVSGVITRGAGGAGIGSATLILTPAGGAALPPVTASAAGAFSVGSVPAGNGSIVVTTLPSGCDAPGPVPYSGVVAGGTVTVNIAITCAAAPITYPISAVWGPITTGGPTGRQVTLSFSIDMGTAPGRPDVDGANADPLSGISFDLTYDGARLDYISRTLLSPDELDLGIANENFPGTVNTKTIVAIGSLSGASKTGSFGLIRLSFNIAAGVSGSISVSLNISELISLNLQNITPFAQVLPISPLVVP